NVAEIASKLQSVGAVYPTDVIAEAGSSGFAELAVRHQAETTKAGERVHVVITAVAKLIERADAVQRAQAGALEIGVYLVPPKVETVKHIRGEAGNQVC